MREVPGAPYAYSETLDIVLDDLARRVAAMRAGGTLTPEVLTRIRKYFRFKDIYNSNAIEGNQLSLGETRMVVREGLTIAGRSLKDHAEARNLSAALDFFDELATGDGPITAVDIRQLHALVLRDINDAAAGFYRTVDVRITGSDHLPPGPETVPAEMADLTGWLRSRSGGGPEYASKNGLLYAAAAHAAFVTIHPFVDGNGRVGRLLMNLLLMRHGFPIAIITMEDRQRYYDALEASQGSDLSAVLALVAESVEESLEQWESAVESQRATEEWALPPGERLAAGERDLKQAEYELWHSAMDLGRNYFRQTAAHLGTSLPQRIRFKDFGDLDFDRYVRLATANPPNGRGSSESTSRLSSGGSRYLFFFARPSAELRGSASRCRSWSAKETPPGSYHYELLEHVRDPNEPALRELGFIPHEQDFVARDASGQIRAGKIESIGSQFIEDVIGQF